MADDDLVRALCDARGRTFQRLEFLGDSVLDVIVSAHVVVAEGRCPVCRDDPTTARRVVSDAALARTGATMGISGWLEWDAAPERLADCVEACVAVAWRSGGWTQAIDLVTTHVHPLGFAALPPPRPPERVDGPAVRQLGAALLELAAGFFVWSTRLQADEGELSRARAHWHRAENVAAHAGSLGVDRSGAAGVVSNRVETMLARLVVSEGPDVALLQARRALGLPEEADPD